MKIGDRVEHRNGIVGVIYDMSGDQLRLRDDQGTPYLFQRDLIVRILALAPEPKPPVTKASLLDAAKEAVADRGLNYGKPEDNFLRIARRWQLHFLNRYGWETPIDAADVAMMMVDLKIARLENDPTHLDSWADTAGYAACGAEITNGQK